MKRIPIFILACVGAAALLPAADVPEIPFDSVPNPLKLPADMHFGEVSGIAMNSKKHVFTFSRTNTQGPAYGAAAAQLHEFGPDGKFIREIGKGLYAWSYAHDVRVDKDDNIWAIDKGSDQIIRFNPEGRVTMIFGRKKEASDKEAEPWERVTPPRPAIDGQFRQPTDVAWDNEGNIFISDGYINSRVAKYDKNGDWVKSWGGPGSKEGEFNTVHGIANDAQGNIYVADRANKRIQVFDHDGKFLRALVVDIPAPAGAKPWMGNPITAQSPPNMHPGSPWTVCITPGPTQYLYTSDAYPGRIYKMTLDGKVVGMLGIAGRQNKQFGWIHQIACPSENEIWVAELLNWRVQKLILHPAK